MSGRGRTSNFDDQVLLVVLGGVESMSTRMLATNFNVEHSTIVRRLKKLGRKAQNANGRTLSLDKFNVHQPFRMEDLQWHYVSNPQLDNAEHEIATQPSRSTGEVTTHTLLQRRVVSLKHFHTNYFENIVFPTVTAIV
ncbi:hypothetical protein TNCV_4604111 [Trichonephila clavipes]|nr:hypothetical protein TNCV_4604111 [Trichonephila clavipes]